MKTIKLSVILLVIVIGFANRSVAQAPAVGLYLTYNDYLNNKLSYKAEANNKLYLHEFIGVSTVTVVSNYKKQVLAKNEVFGYRDKDNVDYRFYDNKSYRIVDTAKFYLYKSEKLVMQGKGPKPVEVYFFSKAGGAIIPLTPDNLERAFPQNHKFKNMVEMAYNSNIKLDAFDKSSNEYKIKELYDDSLK